MATKRCTDCEQFKPIEQFSLRNKKTPEKGHVARCKPCTTARAVAKKHAANPDMPYKRLRDESGDQLVCTCCHESKPKDQFSLKNSQHPEKGHASQCKRCLADKMRTKARAANPDSVPRALRRDTLTGNSQTCEVRPAFRCETAIWHSTKLPW